MNRLADFESEMRIDERPGVDLQYYMALLLTVVRKYSVWAVPVALLASAYAYDRATSVSPTYTARAVMHVAPQSRSLTSVNSFYFGYDSAFQSTQLGILGSRMLMRRIVEDLELHRRDVPPERPRSFLEKLLPWLAEAPQARAEPPEALDPEAERRLIERYAARLRNAVNARTDNSGDYTNLVTVTATWHDAELAAEIANGTTRIYRALLREQEVEQALASQEYLAERLAGLRSDLRTSEERLQAFLGERAPDATEIDQEREASTVSSSLLSARGRRRELEGVLRQVASAGEDLLRVPAVSNQQRVSALRDQLREIDRRRSELSRRYGPRHASMIALESEAGAVALSLRTAISDAVADLEAELSLARSNEADLETALADANLREQETSDDEFRLFDLQQDIDVKRELLVMFTQMYNQGDVNTPIENSNVWVVDPASVPGAANLPSIGTAIFQAALMSFVAVFGLGGLIELNRNTLSTPEELERHLGVPHLGTLPLLRGKEAAEDRLPLTEYKERPESYFSESVRSLRTTLVLGSATHEAKRIVITSTDANEGKSSVALNLAIAFSQMKRTLIIDCDLRRPSLEKALTPHARHSIGLTDVLAGSTKLAECILETSEPGLSLLPAGSRTLNQLEILSSTEFSMLLKALEQRFDLILFDTPPCMAVSDAYVIAAQADSVVYVVKAGSSRIPASRSVIRQLRAMDVEIAGAILNQVDLKSFRYASGYHGYYSYTEYTERGEDETEREVARPARTAS